MKKLMRSGRKSRSGFTKKAGLLLAAIGLLLAGNLPLYALEEVVLDWDPVPLEKEPTQVLLHGVIHHDSLVNPHDVEKCINCHYRKHKSKTGICASRCLDDLGVTHHPVFRKYPPDRKAAEYVPVAKLEKGGIVQLQNNTMTCLSCHDVSNSLPFHLVIEDRESRFCKLCHIR
ncbi:MAG: hypothetical protein HY789_13320 [Deltaproteobacteria bacterium]|nr:hypothetical protein [Deltaproteobacteria bacterium]